MDSATSRENAELRAEVERLRKASFMQGREVAEYKLAADAAQAQLAKKRDLVTRVNASLRLALDRLEAVQAWSDDLAHRSRVGGPTPDMVGRGVARDVAALLTLPDEDEPARCGHRETGPHDVYYDIGRTHDWAGTCPGPAASGSPDGSR